MERARARRLVNLRSALLCSALALAFAFALLEGDCVGTPDRLLNCFWTALDHCFVVVCAQLGVLVLGLGRGVVGIVLLLSIIFLGIFYGSRNWALFSPSLPSFLSSSLTCTAPRSKRKKSRDFFVVWGIFVLLSVLPLGVNLSVVIVSVFFWEFLSVCCAVVIIIISGLSAGLVVFAGTSIVNISALPTYRLSIQLPLSTLPSSL